jgi:hypothetical protein
MGVAIEICVKCPGGPTRNRGAGFLAACACQISGLDQASTPQLFYTYSYNHARRLRLEKLLYLELSRSSNGFKKPLLDPDGGFRSETAVTRRFRK